MLKHLKVEGYRSVASLGLDLGPLNVLEGANGAGKSNILSVLGLLNRLTNHGALNGHVSHQAGASSLLYATGRAIEG